MSISACAILPPNIDEDHHSFRIAIQLKVASCVLTTSLNLHCTQLTFLVPAPFSPFQPYKCTVHIQNIEADVLHPIQLLLSAHNFDQPSESSFQESKPHIGDIRPQPVVTHILLYCSSLSDQDGRHLSTLHDDFPKFSVSHKSDLPNHITGNLVPMQPNQLPPKLSSLHLKDRPF